jgi:hypothetical protein
VVQPEPNQTVQITRGPGRALDLDLDLDVDGEGDGGSWTGLAETIPSDGGGARRMCTSSAVSSHATVIRLARAAADGGGGVSVEQLRAVSLNGRPVPRGRDVLERAETAGELVGGGP